MTDAHQWNPRQPPPPFVRPTRIDPRGVTGPTRGQADGPRWRRSSAGLYLPTSVDPTVSSQRIVEAAALLPVDGAVTGWAALHLCGAFFLDGQRYGDLGRILLPVPLTVGPGQGRRKREGIRYLEDRVGAVERVYDIPCTPALRATFDEMRLSDDLREAVVAMDMAAAAGLVTLDRMHMFVAGHAGWNGVPLVRQALDLADERSDSPQETRYRLVWELDAGLPRPLVNRPVFDLNGRLLGYPDLLDPVAGLVGEYDGDDHRRAPRHSGDVTREGRLRDVGLEVTRATGADVRDRARLAQRILGARGRARFEPPERRAWTLTPPPGFRPRRR
ncbi:MAG TPA: hypothetical protein VFG72_02190 [Marmoricola sp.]|nr:hypothetical protein [Marmoricola sp.]